MSAPSSASQVVRSRRMDSSRPARTCWVEARQRLAQGLARDRDVGLYDAVEPLGVLRDRLDTAVAHVVADRAHDLQRRLDVEVGARDQGAVVGGGPCATVAQVDPANHAQV